MLLSPSVPRKQLSIIRLSNRVCHFMLQIARNPRRIHDGSNTCTLCHWYDAKTFFDIDNFRLFDPSCLTTSHTDMFLWCSNLCLSTIWIRKLELPILSTSSNLAEENRCTVLDNWQEITAIRDEYRAWPKSICKETLFGSKELHHHIGPFQFAYL